MEQTNNENKKIIINNILESENTFEKIIKFQSYRNVLQNCRIFLFDEEQSNLDQSFENHTIGNYSIIGAGDYTKTWVIDSKHNLNNTPILVGKTLDFDLNILTYLNKIMTEQKINIDKKDFIDYLNYIKSNKFQCCLLSAIMERVKTPLKLDIFCEMIISFIKFDNSSSINENNNNIYLSPNDYKRAKHIYDIALKQANTTIEQFDAMCCCVMKAYLIKNYDKNSDKNKKVEKFIRYCLNILNCYLEKEIVLLSLYILDDSKTHKTFKKLKKNSDIIKNILNVTWDIYHIRIIENIMLSDNKDGADLIILPYFATSDKGLIDAMNINPLKAFVIIDDAPIAYHTIKINDICRNSDLLDEVSNNSSIREKRIKQVNFAEIRNQLTDEIIKHQKINN